MRAIKLSLGGLLLCLALLASAAHAAVVYSDPTGQAVSYCGWLLDDLAKRYIVVQAVTGGKRCRYPLAGVAPGPHTISATFVVVDPVYGRKESVLSAPLDFVVPGNPEPPVNLIFWQ